jgi:L-rhamnose isomerase
MASANFIRMMHKAARTSQKKSAALKPDSSPVLDNAMNHNILAGDVVVASIASEFVEQAREEYPAVIGYRFERA